VRRALSPSSLSPSLSLSIVLTSSLLHLTALLSLYHLANPPARPPCRYNTQLASLFSTFPASYPLASFRLYDTVPFFNTLLDNPAQYGIRNATAACDAYAAVTGPPEISLPAQCGVPLEEYAWWNSYQCVALSLSNECSAQGKGADG